MKVLTPEGERSLWDFLGLWKAPEAERSPVGAETGVRMPPVVAVVGCGGKTTLIAQLADCPGKRVLVTPTTKILPMEGPGITLCTNPAQCREAARRLPSPGSGHLPGMGGQNPAGIGGLGPGHLPGMEGQNPAGIGGLGPLPSRHITCMGIQNPRTGKLEALPPELLRALIPRYDLVLLEADGSRGLPCKGWLEDEPVIPDFVTHTLGVLSLRGLGQPATAEHVLRLPEFLALTGAEAGEAIQFRHLAAMVSRRGMFRNARGSCSLILNQVTDPALPAAWAWLARQPVKSYGIVKFQPGGGKKAVSTEGRAL